MTKTLFKGQSTVVGLSHHHPKGLSPGAASFTERVKWQKKLFKCQTRVVEHSLHHPKGKGLSQAAATFTERVKWQKSCLNA